MQKLFIGCSELKTDTCLNLFSFSLVLFSNFSVAKNRRKTLTRADIMLLLVNPSFPSITSYFSVKKSHYLDLIYVKEICLNRGT